MKYHKLTLDGYFTLPFSQAIQVAQMCWPCSEASQFVPAIQEGDYHAPDTLLRRRRVNVPQVIQDCGFRSAGEVRVELAAMRRRMWMAGLAKIEADWWHIGRVTDERIRKMLNQ